MEYVSKELALQDKEKLTWQRPGARVDYMKVYEGMGLTLDDGEIVSEPYVKMVHSREEPGWRLVCDVEYTNYSFDVTAKSAFRISRDRLTCDPFSLISYRHLLQRMLILIALSKK